MVESSPGLRNVGSVIIFTVKKLRTYRGVVNDDITAGHIAMENVFFQVLDERALQSQIYKAKECEMKRLKIFHDIDVCWFLPLFSKEQDVIEILQIIIFLKNILKHTFCVEVVLHKNTSNQD